LLAPIATRPGVRLVVIGGGPAEPVLRKALPGAVFLGPRQGRQLARLYASLDVFVHSGPYETFGQTVQEASASGVPVVAPAAGGPTSWRPGRAGCGPRCGPSARGTWRPGTSRCSSSPDCPPWTNTPSRVGSSRCPDRCCRSPAGTGCC